MKLKVGKVRMRARRLHLKVECRKAKEVTNDVLIDACPFASF